MSRTLLAIFACALSASTRGAPPADKIAPPDYLLVFHERHYPDLAAFTAKVKALETPFQQLFVGITEKDGYYDFEPVQSSEIQGVNIIADTPEYAIVQADARRSRYWFCAVVFLLGKDSEGLRVTDLILRSDWGTGAYFAKAEMLPLRPSRYPHLHIAVGRGGRLDGTDDDEFFIVKEGQFKRTLALTTGCYFRGGRFAEYSQSAEPQAKDGQLQLVIQRSYRRLNSQKEEKEKFVVPFRWDIATQQFTSKETWKVNFPSH